jgi:C_GCAxxG_C_C family probable redox protein
MEKKSDRVEAAVSFFKQGFNCSQAVFAVFADQFGIDEETALKISAGFGGGIGAQGLTCGAVTGAIMVIGLKHGGTKPEDTDAKKQTYRLARELSKRFKERNCGTIECRELLKCDMSTKEGYEEAKKRDVHNTVCPKFVADAAEILEEIL